MSENQANQTETRAAFSGTFDRIGSKKGWRGPEQTLLVKNVINAEGQVVMGQVWLKSTEEFASLDLCSGDVIEFDARVNESASDPSKGGFRLSHPSNVFKRSSIIFSSKEGR